MSEFGDWNAANKDDSSQTGVLSDRISDLELRLEEIAQVQTVQMRVLNELLARSTNSAAFDALFLKKIETMMNSQTTNLGEFKLTTTTRAGQKMFIDGRDTGSGLEIVENGYIEPNVLRALQRAFVSSGVFLDIGANFGFYSIFAAAQMGTESVVYSFEANPHLISFIERSAYVNGLSNRVNIINKAVSDQHGIARFGFSFAEIGGGSLALGAESTQPLDRNYVDVPLIPVDDVLPANLIVNVAKLDVEGNEASTLRGMRRTIERSPDIQLVLEFFPGLHIAEGSKAILDELDAVGLSYWKIGDDSRLIAYTREELLAGGDCYLLAARQKPDDSVLVLPANAMTIPGTRDEAGCLSGSVDQVLVHGPYWFLMQGVYDIELDADILGEVRVTVAHEFGHDLYSTILNEDRKSFGFSTNRDLKNFEIVVRSMSENNTLLFRKFLVRHIS